MEPIEPHQTLGELVTSRPSLAPALDRLGLDYCCGGARRLDQAVAEAGGDLAEVIAELDEVGPVTAPADWAGLDPTDLVDHLVATHHAYLEEALPRLDALANKVATVHGERHPELANVRDLVTAIRADLEPHLRTEEQVLFPAIRALADGGSTATAEASIEALGAEHDALGELLTAVRAATVDFLVPGDGCASYRALYDGLAELESDTHLHVHKENNVLFPAVLGAGR